MVDQTFLSKYKTNQTRCNTFIASQSANLIIYTNNTHRQYTFIHFLPIIHPLGLLQSLNDALIIAWVSRRLIQGVDPFEYEYLI